MNGLKEERIGQTDSVVQRSSGSILQKYKEAEDFTESNPINRYQERIDQEDFGSDFGPKESTGPVSRGTALGVDDMIKAEGWEGVTENALKTFEGFKTKAYWDVNAWRVGHGTDTIYDAKGNKVKVTKNTTVTPEQALAHMQRRYKEDFLPTAREQVGTGTWDGLTNNTKAAVLSITYNYGRVPPRIRGAIQTGDRSKIAEAIRGLAGDNDGVNKNRRYTEAELVMRDDWTMKTSKNKPLVVRPTS